MTQDMPYHDLTTVKANTIEIAYDAFGEESSPPILLISGLSEQLIDWGDAFCKELASKGFYVIRFDNRDSGLSTKFDDAEIPDINVIMQKIMSGGAVTSLPYTMKDMADDAIGLLDAIGVDSANIVGFSIGGGIAQLMSIHYPNKVRTMTCIGYTTGDPSLPDPSPEAQSVLFTPRPTAKEGFIQATVDALRFSNGDVLPFNETKAIDLTKRAYDRSFNPAGTIRQLAASLTLGSVKDELQNVKIPTLVIHGDADPFFPIECGKDIAESIPNSKLVIIKGFGHILPELYTKEVQGQIIDAISNIAE